MTQKSEERASNKLLTFMPAGDMLKWNVQIKRIIKKIKKDPADDYDTEYVDVDSLLKMYCEEFIREKRSKRKKLLKGFGRVFSGSDVDEVSIDNIDSIVKNMGSNK